MIIVIFIIFFVFFFVVDAIVLLVKFEARGLPHSLQQ
jgi:hypothetical protein